MWLNGRQPQMIEHSIQVLAADERQRNARGLPDSRKLH
jgi:hypothetical protein